MQLQRAGRLISLSLPAQAAHMHFRLPQSLHATVSKAGRARLLLTAAVVHLLRLWTARLGSEVQGGMAAKMPQLLLRAVQDLLGIQ